jgi:quercetin dioxygenase-like cupin family protein
MKRHNTAAVTLPARRKYLTPAMRSDYDQPLMQLRLFLTVLIVGRAGIALAQIPVEVEPHHHPVFENAVLRVLSVTVRPGDSSLEHLHLHDIALVCLSGSVRTRPAGGDWTPVSPECKPGTSRIVEYTGKPVSHTIRNFGNAPYHLVAVENLRRSGWSNDEPVDRPDLILESRAFRIYALRLSPGAEITHTHKVSTIAIPVGGQVTAGKAIDNQPGGFVFIPAGEPHRLAATGSMETEIVEIEVR